jgi:hypothetical protein
VKRHLAFEGLEGKLLQSAVVQYAGVATAVYSKIDTPIDDPAPKPEPDPGPLPTDEPPIIIPPLPPSGPVGPGAVSPIVRLR